jgi:hypothetical protein
MGIGGPLPGVKGGRGVNLITHPLLVPRSWMCTSCTSSSPCRLHGGSGRALLYWPAGHHPDPLTIPPSAWCSFNDIPVARYWSCSSPGRVAVWYKQESVCLEKKLRGEMKVTCGSQPLIPSEYSYLYCIGFESFKTLYYYTRREVHSTLMVTLVCTLLWERRRFVRSCLRWGQEAV